MNEDEARSVLLIRAIEQTDSTGIILAQTERVAATRQACPSMTLRESSAAETNGAERECGEEQTWIVRRAEMLRNFLERRSPVVAQVYDRSRWPRGVGALLGAAAFLLGFLSNELGTEKRVNIIAFPLLGMIAWNVAVYALTAVQEIRRALNQRPWKFKPLERVVLHWTLRVPVQPHTSSHAIEDRILAQGLARFAGDWLVAGGALHRARIRRVLHLCAALLAAGTLAGMYARGLALEYTAGWESTFLHSNTVHSIVSFVLGPASWLTGISIPGPAEIQSMRWTLSSAGRNAAPWIHLYAVTAAWTILLPRLILAAVETWRTIRAADFRIVDPSDDYFAHLLRAPKGNARIVRVIPYGMQLSAAGRETLRTLFFELYGWRAEIDFLERITYGTEEQALPLFSEEERRGDLTWVVLFSMSSTPEQEAHGRLLHELMRRVGHRDAVSPAELIPDTGTSSSAPFSSAPPTSGSASEVLVLLDASSYRRRFGEAPGLEHRMKERRRIWDELAAQYQLAVAVVDLEAAGAPPNLDEVRSAIWTRERAGNTGS